jgi:hypothetical protein
MCRRRGKELAGLILIHEACQKELEEDVRKFTAANFAKALR